MSLQVWLPLTGHLNNQGLSNVTVTNNGATVDNNGKIGKCYNFNGSSRISCSSLTVSYPMSISGWFKPTDFTNVNTQYWISYNTGTGGTAGHAIGIGTYSGLLGIWFGGTNVTISNSGITNNNWYHIAVTIDSNKKVIIYLNGVQIATNTFTSNHPGSTWLTLGARSNSATGGAGDASYYYKGYMNDARFYDHALSAKEVKELSKGLVLHYPLSDMNIESTTNLWTSADISTSCYNGSTGKYGYGINTDIYKTIGTFNNRYCMKIYMGTSGNNARPYIYLSNLFTSNGTNMPAYKTLSFDYYGTIGTYLSFYKLGNGNGTGTWKNYTTDASGTFTNSGNITVAVNKWNHIVLTLHGTTDANSEWGFCILGDTHVSDISNYWLFANAQLETKDHATGYAGIGGSRNETTVYDVSGYNNHGIINTAMTVDENTARYNYSLIFDGVSNAIQIPFNEMLGLTVAGKCDYTISVFTYKTVIGADNYQTILGGPSGFELEARSVSATDPLYRIHNWGGGTTPYEFGKWTLFTFVHTTSDCKLYVNGELKITGSSQNVPIGDFFIGAWKTAVQQNFQGNMSDFRIYATALSAEDVKQLYNTAAALCNNGTLFAYDFVEV